MAPTAFPYQELRRGANGSALRSWLAQGGQIDSPILHSVAETWTPLMLACAQGDINLVRTLIDEGSARASASVGSKVLASLAPLHVASRYGHTVVASILLELGAVVDVKDTAGLTPLHYASGNGHLKTMEVLLEAGARESEEGPGGAIALDLAIMASFPDAASLLRRRAVGGEAAANRKKAFGAWLEALGCEDFLGRFLRAGYDDLPFLVSHGLTDADLDCVGIPREKLGLRKKLLVMYGVEKFLNKIGGEVEDDGSGGSDGADDSGTEETSTETGANESEGGNTLTDVSDEDESVDEGGSSSSEGESSDSSVSDAKG